MAIVSFIFRLYVEHFVLPLIVADKHEECTSSFHRKRWLFDTVQTLSNHTLTSPRLDSVQW